MYVVQPHLRDLLLWDQRSADSLGSGTVGAKFHVRAYAFVYSPPGGRDLHFFSHPHGYIAVGDAAWTPHSRAKLGCQVTRDRTHRWQDWHRYDETYGPALRTMARVFEMLAPKLDPGDKGAFQLFGVDFVFDNALRPWLLEINTGPCVQEGDVPMLEKMLEIVVPAGLTERSDAAPEWDLMFQCEALPHARAESENSDTGVSPKQTEANGQKKTENNEHAASKKDAETRESPKQTEANGPKKTENNGPGPCDEVRDSKG